MSWSVESRSLVNYKSEIVLRNIFKEMFERSHLSQVVHQGMRSYFFSADTQEDMLGWVRALSQSASMEPDGILNRCGAVCPHPLGG